MTSFDFEGLCLRQATKADNRFVRDLYCTSRDYEIKHVPWPEAQINAFLKDQFALQTKHYSKVYPKAERNLIVYQGVPIGRFFTDFDRQRKKLHLIDITVLREYRGKGIGGFYLEGLIARAKEKNAELSLYVHRLNPALKWYQALGFTTQSITSDNFFLVYGG